MTQPTKAHTHQPAHTTPQRDQSYDNTLIALAFVAVPIVGCLFVWVAWKILRGLMGYRTVRYERD